MDIKINERGNGQCPDCARYAGCSIHSELRNSLVHFNDPEKVGMELVIFQCPACKRNIDA